MTKYFGLEESPNYKDKYIITIDPQDLPIGLMYGSMSLLEARLMNLDYATYLRFCRDVLGAEIIGKTWGYPVAYFTKTPEVQQFVKLLNSRMAFVMNEYNHPYDLKVDENGNFTKVEF